jgi:glucokinase
VGGGIMIDGKLIQGQQGRAGHIGHISINNDYHLGIVKTPGNLERSIGEGTVSERTYGRFPSTKALVEAHLEGDTFATWVWLNSVQALTRGIVSLINAISPEIIILGGGISRSGDALLGPLKDFMDVYEWRPGGFATMIKLANLGNHAGAVGAALFARERGRNFQ